MTLKQTLIAIGTIATLAGTAQAADVETILGRGAPVGTVNVERILVTGTTVDKVLGRAGFVAANNTSAKFAVGNGSRRAVNGNLLQRYGRA